MLLTSLVLGCLSCVLPRYQVLSPYNVTSPIHEFLTQETLRKTGDITGTYCGSDMLQFKQGVVWNDDPERYLFDGITGEYSTGGSWLAGFNIFEGDAEK